MNAISQSGLGRALATRLGFVSGGFLVIVLMVALTAPWITPFDVAAQDLANSNAAPGWPHLLGTDEFGRDVLSRIMYGARTSLSVSATAIGISMVFGMALGAAAGYFGGIFERAVMTVVDLTWSFPDVDRVDAGRHSWPRSDQHDVCLSPLPTWRSSRGSPARRSSS